MRRNKKKGNYGEGDSLISDVNETISEGKKELDEAVRFMNKIKIRISEYHGNKESFFEEVAEDYSRRAEEYESGSDQPKSVSKLRALVDVFLPVVVGGKGPDPTKKKFGKILNTLVADAEDIYGHLDGKLDEHEERFNKIDNLTDGLLLKLKKYRKDVEDYDAQKTQYERELKTLQKKLSTKKTTGQAYLDLQGNILTKKRELENAQRQRTLAINKYNNTNNIFETLGSLRDGNRILLDEGKILQDTLETNIDTLKPLFDQISSSADLVEFQQKALEAEEMLRDTFNPTIQAIAMMSKGITKTAIERSGQKFITDDTIESVKLITDAQKEEIEEHRKKKEDEMRDEILGKKSPKEDADVVVLEENEEGTFEENTAEEVKE